MPAASNRTFKKNVSK